MSVRGTTVARRQLGRWLRQLRTTVGKTEADVEAANLASRVKLWRIETGKGEVKFADVRALCWLYGADSLTTDALANLAQATRGHGWWEDFRSTPPRYALRSGLEPIADSIDAYEPERVHPLLQTPDYMRALYLVSRPEADQMAVREYVHLERERQRALLTRTPPPRLTVVLGEAALARSVGGADVMDEQIAHLQDLALELPLVDIRILPLQAGAHPAIHGGAFGILGFPAAEDPAVVHIEAQTGARYLERLAEVTEYRRVFTHIYAQAVSINEFRGRHTDGPG
ncbi:helix-turn-helix transcriptional regulator [Virgisporangium ochraceum]|uniref:Transcriptional regulator n=1 Tax=Virgisporangium ochraceum TaxID=65505 RepID=A0A8J3ZUN0_9ACTN|nr:helix-turn-helix transcriptional regulator [Virgisporangium ochraceum]GIJ69961.1 transcriptional regulator [Virgisporangium ochraceum]